MYKIYADDTLIYDSTLEDYKIGKGEISLEVNKSGSFNFSVYPNHFYYDKFVKLKTVITVYKSEKIIFRGRILNDVSDYQNNKVITCEGELGFLQDSVIRPFDFKGSPEDLFKKFIEEHNSQVDDSKKFKIGKITVTDANNYIARSNSSYESAFSNMNSRLLEDSLGGYFYVTHGSDGTEVEPTINYLSDFTETCTQNIEFGSNLKDYTRTTKANDVATVLIPLGAQIDNGDENVDNPRLTISSVNNNKDYIEYAEAIALYGRIAKVVTWDDVTDANNLLTKGEEYLKSVSSQNVTIALTAVDLHLLDRSIESFHYGEYINISSEPHNVSTTMLCSKQTINLLSPQNDTVTLGYTYSTFTESTVKYQGIIKSVSDVRKSINSVASSVSTIASDLSSVSGTVTTVSETVKKNTEELSEATLNALKAVYPVGSIYFTTVDTNPAEVFGFGTWKAWGSGKVPVGVDSSITEFNAVEKTSGALTHTHRYGIQLGAYYGASAYENSTASGAVKYSMNSPQGTGNAWSTVENATVTVNSGATKSSQSVTASVKRSESDTTSTSNIQPSITCYMWKRTE